MRENWKASFDRVIKSEGGYTNDPNDHGGETNLGVTKANWEQYVGRPAQPGEMLSLTPAMVEPLYRADYWDKCRCDELPAGVDYAVFDFSVNAGPGRSIRYLQRAAGVTDDGQLGPGTMAAVKAEDPHTLLTLFSQQKIGFYQRIVARDASQEKFLKGWLNRVREVQVSSDAMIS